VGECQRETICGVREPWQHINAVVVQALRQVTLADLIGDRRPFLDLELAGVAPARPTDAGPKPN
jgi:DNA-binding IscR family transcriptional regulator